MRSRLSLWATVACAMACTDPSSSTSYQSPTEIRVDPSKWSTSLVCGTAAGSASPDAAAAPERESFGSYRARLIALKMPDGGRVSSRVAETTPAIPCNQGLRFGSPLVEEATNYLVQVDTFESGAAEANLELPPAHQFLCGSGNSDSEAFPIPEGDLSENTAPGASLVWTVPLAPLLATTKRTVSLESCVSIP